YSEDSQRSVGCKTIANLADMDERELSDYEYSSDDYNSDDDYIVDFVNVIEEYSDYDYNNDGDYVKIIGEMTETCKVLDYGVLSKANIKKLQEDAITEVSSLLCLSRGEASILLPNHD
ncbi:hypothetical protein Tsubulata_030577, partial [Turnera subulata]